jgi:hypothetical protein
MSDQPKVPPFNPPGNWKPSAETLAKVKQLVEQPAPPATPATPVVVAVDPFEPTQPAVEPAMPHMFLHYIDKLFAPRKKKAISGADIAMMIYLLRRRAHIDPLIESQQQIADSLGVNPGTVARSLGRLEKSGHVTVKDRGRVGPNDPRKLANAVKVNIGKL